MARRPDGEIGEIRKQFERQCLSALAATPNISRGELVRRFGEGVGRGTGFRWIAELLGDGGQEKADTGTPDAPALQGGSVSRPPFHPAPAADPPPPAAAQPSATPPPPPPSAAPASPPVSADPMPLPPDRPAEQPALAGEVIAPDRQPGTVGIEVNVSAAGELAGCLEVARLLIAHARDENGRPRNVRLLLAASEHRRRTIETLVKVQAVLVEHGKLEEWLAAIIAEVEKADPKTHRRLIETLMASPLLAAKAGGRIQ